MRLITPSCIVLGLFLVTTAAVGAPARQIHPPLDDGRTTGPSAEAVDLSTALLPDVTVFPEPSGTSEKLWAGDVLVCDYTAETEGYVDMASSFSGRFYAAVEYMDATGYCVRIFRSNDGGAHWSLFAVICGGGQDVHGASVAAAEVTQDYIYVASLFAGNCILTKINIADGTTTSTVVGADDGSYGNPRLTTDDIQYSDYYIYLVYGGGKFTRSTDKGVNWSAATFLHPDAYTVMNPDIAYANGNVYATWWYLLAGKTAFNKVPYGIAARVSADFGGSWQTVKYIAEDANTPRIEAIEAGTQAMIVYAKSNGTDSDVKYAYTTDSGVTWTAEQCLDCTAGVQENAPDIAVDGYLGSFRVAYWRAGDDIAYKQAPAATPTSWSLRRTLSDTRQATSLYAPPAVSVNYANSRAGVIWNDSRKPTKAVYFDAEGARRYIINAAGTGHLPTIQAAVDVAVDGDTLELENGTFTGAGNRDIDTKGKAIVILSSSGDPETCIIDCQGSAGSPHRGFYIRTGEGLQTRILSVQIRNGYVPSSGGGINVSNASPYIANCIFQSNYAYDGGGVFLSSSGAVIFDCTFRNNSAGDAGGGMMIQLGLPQVSFDHFTSNTAVWGGGALYLHDSGPGVDHCEFVDNQSTHWGGAVHNNLLSSDGYFSYCIFRGNSAPYGGAMYNRGGSTPLIESTTFYGNSASVAGGGIYSTDTGTWTRADQTIISFSGQGSAVVCANNGAAQLTCCDVFGNAGGDWTDCIGGQSGVSGNMSLDPYFCDAEAADFRLASNSPCAPANNTCGLWIGSQIVIGCSAVDVAGFPSTGVMRLLPNVPNPFGSGTVIPFELAASSKVDLIIYNVAGRCVRKLVSGGNVLAAGKHEAFWDGRDEAGHPVAGGVYLCSLRAGSSSESRRLLLVH